MLVWALYDPYAPNSVKYYFSVFNLNNWYVQCMPSKMRPLYEEDKSNGTIKTRKNIYFSNFIMYLSDKFDLLKVSYIFNNLKTFFLFKISLI